MRYVYPVTVEQDEEGRYLAIAPDVPEALTDGETPQQALREMSEALGAALAGYAKAGQALPVPSATGTHVHWVPVAPLVAAKLALMSAMRDEGISNVALAQRLGLSEGAVRRLVDPDHSSRLDGVIRALTELGHELIIEDRKQSAA